MQMDVIRMDFETISIIRKMMEIGNRLLIKFVHSIYIVLQAICFQCKFRI